MNRKHLLIMLVAFVLGMCVVVYVLQEKSDEVVHPYAQAVEARNADLSIDDLVEASKNLNDAAARELILDGVVSDRQFERPLPVAFVPYRSRMGFVNNSYKVKDVAKILIRDHPHLFIEGLIGRLRELSKVTPIVEGLKGHVWETPNGDLMSEYLFPTTSVMLALLPDDAQNVELEKKKRLRIRQGRRQRSGFMSYHYVTSNTRFALIPTIVLGLGDDEGELEKSGDEMVRVVDVSPENINQILDAMENYYKAKLKGKSK